VQVYGSTLSDRFSVTYAMGTWGLFNIGFGTDGYPQNE
jgi:hypothetical protein